jgi:hypothetical protein
MSDLIIRSMPPRDARWSYDDPSGVPDSPLEVSLPQPLRGSVETAAARAGLSPSQWLTALVTRSLSPLTGRAA